MIVIFKNNCIFISLYDIMIDPNEGCSKCKQFQQNALDAYAIIKRMSTQKNRSAPDLAEVINLKKLNDEQSQYIINQRKFIERLTKEKDELDSSNKHLKIKNEEMNSQYNDLILSLGEVRKKVEETFKDLTETKKKYDEVLKKEESFRKSMEQFVLCKKMLLSTFSIIKQIKSGQIADDAYNTVGIPNRSKKKENKKVPVEVIQEDSGDDDDELEKILISGMDLSSSEDEEVAKEEAISKPDVAIVYKPLENKVENKKVPKKTTRKPTSSSTRKSNRIEKKNIKLQETIPVVENISLKPTKVSNTITGRKTKSVKEQISEMNMEKIREKYKSDMEKMKQNVEAIKMTKNS